MEAFTFRKVIMLSAASSSMKLEICIVTILTNKLLQDNGITKSSIIEISSIS